jgi:predicted signal transduction protein with EAL and GGDEF domain
MFRVPPNLPIRRPLLLLLVAAATAIAILQLQPPGQQLLALALLLVLLRQDRQQQQLRASAQALSQRDPLTGLPNRPHFLQEIDRAAERARRSRRPFAVLFVDIDQFRSLNDTYGHATGDRVLIAVAERLRHTVRLGDGPAPRARGRVRSHRQRRRQPRRLPAVQRPQGGDAPGRPHHGLPAAGARRWPVVEPVGALARWQHPTRGFVPPDRFIAVAERYRLMGELGDQIFSLSLQGFQAIRQALRLPGLRLSANISPSQLSDPELHRRLAAMLAEAGVPPQLITLEITEVSILERNTATEANLEQFRRQGYRLALDDFGTGYSSLSRLSTLRPEEIKIDKSFVMALGSDAMAEQIVAVISSMARHMDLQLVAEGVEDAATLGALQQLGIPLFQGYHFQRPLLPEALIAAAA